MSTPLFAAGFQVPNTGLGANRVPEAQSSSGNGDLSTASTMYTVEMTTMSDDDEGSSILTSGSSKSNANFVTTGVYNMEEYLNEFVANTRSSVSEKSKKASDEVTKTAVSSTSGFVEKPKTRSLLHPPESETSSSSSNPVFSLATRNQIQTIPPETESTNLLNFSSASTASLMESPPAIPQQQVQDLWKQSAMQTAAMRRTPVRETPNSSEKQHAENNTFYTQIMNQLHSQHQQSSISATSEKMPSPPQLSASEPPTPVPVNSPLQSVSIDTAAPMEEERIESQFDVLGTAGAHAVPNWPFTLENAPAETGRVDRQGNVVQVADEPSVPYGPAWTRARTARIVALLSDPLYRFVRRTAGKVNSKPDAFWTGPFDDTIVRRRRPTSQRQPAPALPATQQLSDASFRASIIERTPELKALQESIETTKQDLIRVTRRAARKKTDREREIAQIRNGGNIPQFIRNVDAEDATDAQRQLLEDIRDSTTTSAENLSGELRQFLVDLIRKEIEKEQKEANDEKSDIQQQIASTQRELEPRVEALLTSLRRTGVLDQLLQRADPSNELTKSYVQFLDALKNQQTPRAQQFLRAIEQAAERELGLIVAGSRSDDVLEQRGAQRRQWLALPENLGLFFWDSIFDAALKEAHDAVLYVAKKEFLLYDLMVQETVNGRFSELTAAYILRTRQIGGNRFQRGSVLADTNRRIRNLIEWFKGTAYDNNDEIVYLGYNPHASATIQQRQLQLESGPDSFSISQPTLQPEFVRSTSRDALQRERQNAFAASRRPARPTVIQYF